MNIELPKDAEGREIPLDTRELCDKDGKRRKVDLFMFYPDKDRWDVVFKDSYAHFSPRNLSLDSPDSWNKLLDDMERAMHTPDPGTYDSLMCGYFDSANTDCDECERKHRICRETCNDAAWLDITARIHKLMVGDGK